MDDEGENYAGPERFPIPTKKPSIHSEFTYDVENSDRADKINEWLNWLNAVDYFRKDKKDDRREQERQMNCYIHINTKNKGIIGNEHH